MGPVLLQATGNCSITGPNIVLVGFNTVDAVVDAPSGRFAFGRYVRIEIPATGSWTIPFAEQRTYLVSAVPQSYYLSFQALQTGSVSCTGQVVVTRHEGAVP
jgi:hypothetical protein